MRGCGARRASLRKRDVMWPKLISSSLVMMGSNIGMRHSPRFESGECAAYVVAVLSLTKVWKFDRVIVYLLSNSLTGVGWQRTRVE